MRAEQALRVLQRAGKLEEYLGKFLREADDDALIEIMNVVDFHRNRRIKIWQTKHGKGYTLSTMDDCHVYNATRWLAKVLKSPKTSWKYSSQLLRRREWLKLLKWECALRGIDYTQNNEEFQRQNNDYELAKERKLSKMLYWRKLSK